MVSSAVRLLMLTGGLWLLSGCTTAPPPVSHDGLHLASQRSFDEVYLKPDVSLAQYSAIRLEPCTVAFRGNWLRSQNSSRSAGRTRVTEQDMQAISDRLARSCDEHFKKALENAPSYRIVDAAARDDMVLEVRPKIIDLDLTAPDISDPGITRTYTTSSGEMTLYLEAYDAASGEIVARVVDKKRDFDTMRLEWTNRATNMADANRYLRSWTRSLRNSLDAARAP